jgi:4-carboxymuconolactone decarboxylase
MAGRKNEMTDRKARGREIRNASYGAEGVKYWENLHAICPDHADSIHEFIFGTVWDRPTLDPKTRHLVTLAIAVSMDAMTEVAMQTRGALNRGATRDEILETILHCAPYVGFPKANHGFKAAQAVFNQWEEKHEDWKPLIEPAV